MYWCVEHPNPIHEVCFTFFLHLFHEEFTNRCFYFEGWEGYFRQCSRLTRSSQLRGVTAVKVVEEADIVVVTVQLQRMSSDGALTLSG